jgi:hypothetical protein
MAVINEKLPAGSVTITIHPEGVATSSTFVAGVESDAVTNITNLDLDHQITGVWRAGTTPTANTQVQIWIVAPISDNLAGTVTWPDVFDGTNSAETVTSAGVLQGFGRLGAVLNIDSNTSSRDYAYGPFSVAALYGGFMPTQYVVFITNGSGATSDATAGNFNTKYIRIQATSV